MSKKQRTEVGGQRSEIGRQRSEIRRQPHPFNDQPSPSHIIGGAVSEDLFNRGLCLPSGTAMTDEDLERVVGVVRGVGKERRRG